MYFIERATLKMVDLDTVIMAAIVPYILILEKISSKKLSKFAARKLCHAGCGLGMMLLDSTRTESQVFVWTIAASSILMTWNLSPLPPFRFARPKDVGITGYLILVSMWFAMELPPTVLAPLFFADPAGAVIGKFATRQLGHDVNLAWYDQKTIAGTLAVFIFTYFTIMFEVSNSARITIATAAAFVEAIGGEYDNLGIAAVVICAWHWTQL